MCIAMPGRIVSIDNDRAKVDVSGNILDINIKLVSPKIGDYVLIHAGCAIEVLDKSSADELTELFDEIEGASDDRA